MNEFKNIIINFCLLTALCSGSFCSGCILSNSKAIRQLNKANQQLRDIGAELSKQVLDNEITAEELSAII